VRENVEILVEKLLEQEIDALIEQKAPKEEVDPF
jgi:hypothetical protein